MPTYIMLIKFTQQGAANIKDSPNRLESAKQAFQDAGGELKAGYLTMGQYDSVFIIEMPNDTAMARLALRSGALGNVTTETLRAFTEDEYRPLIAGLP